MVKRWIAAFLAAGMCISFAACGGKDASEQKQPATADVVEAVSANLTFKDQMMVLDDVMVSNIYRLDEDKLEEKTVKVSATGATAEEVSVFKVKDSADVQMVKDAIAERIEDQKISYQNYVPAEMVKIEGAVTYTQGNYVILVMADDTSSVEKTFQEQF